MLSLAELTAAWTTAVADASFEASEIRLYLCDPGPGGADAAFHLEPGSHAYYDARMPLERNQLDDANAPASRDLHRILLKRPGTPRVALGLLRHELHHARQYEDAGPGVYAFMAIAQDALRVAVDSIGVPTEKYSAALYNALPHERDANRAAASLADREYGPASDEDLDGDHGNLFRETGAPDSSTLAGRLLALLSLYPESLPAACDHHGRNVGSSLDLLGTDAANAWAALVADQELREWGARALAAAPTEEDVAARRARAWAPAVDLLDEGCTEALARITSH